MFDRLGGSQVRFNDDYSSIDLPDGVGIKVFEHASFSGRSQIFTNDVSLIGLLNDQVSSYRTFPLASSYRVDRLNSDGTECQFSTPSDSAASDVDFSSYSAVRNLATEQTEDVVYVDSRADNLNEGTERFNVSISKVNDADAITTASTFGHIFNVNIPSPAPSGGLMQPNFSLSEYRNGNVLWRYGFAPASTSPPGGSKLGQARSAGNSNETILISESAYNSTPSKSFLFKTRTIAISNPSWFMTI